MRARSLLILTMIVLVLGTAASCGSAGNGGPMGFDLRTMDPSGDTAESYYVESEYDGPMHLDITLLRTYDDRSVFHAVLTVDDAIYVDPGFLYSMSYWGVNVVVDSGTVQIWKGDDPADEISNVDVTWSGMDLQASMPRSVLDLGAEPPKASAQFYRLDALGEKRIETVMDTVEWKGPVPLNPYEMNIPDPKGDVVQSNVEMKTIREPSLDIIDVKVAFDGELLEATIDLDGPPKTGPGVRYRVLLGELDLLYSNMDLTVLGSGAWKVRSSDTVIAGSKLTMTAALTEPLISPFSIYTETLEWTEGGGWKGDSAPKDESRYSALLPFGMGNGLQFTASVRPTGEVRVLVRFTGFDAEEASMVRERSDADADGYVSVQEAEPVFKGAMSCLEQGEWTELPIVDGAPTKPTVTVRTEGLVGPTTSSDELIVEYAVELEGPSLHEGWSLEFHRWQHKVSSYGSFQDIRTSSVEISVPEGYYIKPLSLEPALLGNHLTMDGRRVLAEGVGPEMLSIASGGFSMVVGRSSSGDDDGPGPEKESGPWPLYLLASAATIAFLVALLVWWRYGSGKDD